MISGDGNVLGNITIDPSTVMLNLASLSVYGLSSVCNFTSKNRKYTLSRKKRIVSAFSNSENGKSEEFPLSHTHSQYWDFPRKMINCVLAHSGVFIRMTWAGRDDQLSRFGSD